LYWAFCGTQCAKVAHTAAPFGRGDVVADVRVALQKADPERAAFVRRAQARMIDLFRSYGR
jgi:hypothetical protein